LAIHETSETIQLSGQSCWQDHKHVHRLILPLRKRIVIHGVVLLFVFVVISAFRPQAPIGPIAFAIFAAIYFVMLYRLQRRIFGEGQANRASTQMEMDDCGVLVRTVDQETRFAWSAFETVTRDDRFIVLRGREMGRMPMVILPKSWCRAEGDWTRVEQLVAKWLPPAARVFTTEEARQFRLEHLSAEFALKRFVFLLLALSLVITFVAFIVPFSVTSEQGFWYVVIFRVQSVLVTAVCCLTAWGVRRFAAWSRLPLQVLAALCLPLFPLGTGLGARVLYLLTTGPEPHLLTSEYEQIVRIAGPIELQKSSRIRPFLWVVLALVVLIIGLVCLISLIPEEFRHNL
jgi:Ca2+/Na+ antiporter